MLPSDATASHGKLLEQKLRKRGVERLHRGVNQTHDDLPRIARWIERERDRASGRARQPLRGGRDVIDVIVIHVGHVAVILKLAERGIRGGRIAELQTVDAQFVIAANDFRAEQFGKSINVRTGLELHQQFIRHMPGR